MHGNSRYDYYKIVVFWSKIEKCKHFCPAAGFGTSMGTSIGFEGHGGPNVSDYASQSVLRAMPALWLQQLHSGWDKSQFALFWSSALEAHLADLQATSWEQNLGGGSTASVVVTDKTAGAAVVAWQMNANMTIGPARSSNSYLCSAHTSPSSSHPLPNFALACMPTPSALPVPLLLLRPGFRPVYQWSSPLPATMPALAPEHASHPPNPSPPPPLLSTSRAQPRRVEQRPLCSVVQQPSQVCRSCLS